MSQECKTIVIAAGGEGRRLKDYFFKVDYEGTKVLYPINGKPLLQHVIEIALAAEMERIFVLTKHNEDAVKNFLYNRYGNDSRIVTSTGPQDATISAELLVLERELSQPFVYADGNILYSPSLLKSLMNTKQDSLATISVSKKDYAPTHLNVQISNKSEISSVGTRLSQETSQQNDNAYQYFSLGVMLFDPKIFTILKQHKDIYDLDYLIEHIYNDVEIKDCLSCFVYDDEWAGLHIEDDIEKMEKYIKTCS